MSLFFILYTLCSCLTLVGVMTSKWGRIVPRRIKRLLMVAFVLGMLVDFFLWGNDYSNSFLLNQF